MDENSQLEPIKRTSPHSNQVIQQIRGRMLQAAAVGAYKYTKHRQPVPIGQLTNTVYKDYQLPGSSSILETKSILKGSALIGAGSTPAKKNVSFSETSTIKPYERDSTKPMRRVRRRARKSARAHSRDISLAWREIPPGSEEDANSAMAVFCRIVETTIYNIYPIFCVGICLAKVLVIFNYL